MWSVRTESKKLVAQLVRAHPTLYKRKGVRSVVQVHSGLPIFTHSALSSRRIVDYASLELALIEQKYRLVIECHYHAKMGL